MKKTIFAVGLGILLGTGCSHRAPPENPASFNFQLVSPEHVHMQMLLANAMGYVNPSNGVIDAASGYPVEGWNHEPENGLYLRSFTQLTAIGEWVELLANIAAGYADNPYISREEAFSNLSLTVSSLLADQSDPALSAKGLLSNFLGFENGKRIGPLAEEVNRQAFVDEFGAEQADAIWQALAAHKWILPQQDGSFAKIPRKGEYGEKFFTGELEPFAADELRARIMALLDRRTVQIIFGDNANLTASAAKAFGALMHSEIKDFPEAVKLRGQLERFIDRQAEGYRYLYGEESGTFAFGWNATMDRFTGWADGNGKWITGRMNYFVNEFRGPLCFVVQRFDLPADAVKNSGMKIKPYRMADGRDLYTLATWHGSSFQSLGLSLFMQELDAQGWRENLENSVDIELDFAIRHKLPGFLSEAYSGNGVEYTGDIGIPDVAVTDQARITNSPSLYTLGVAYEVAPDKVEAFLASNWKTIRRLFTDHGPWEGFNTAKKEVIRFQTTAHTLALVLGGIGSAGENMQRYLTWRGVTSLSKVQGGESSAVDLLSGGAKWITWSPSGDGLEGVHWMNGFRVRGDAVQRGAVTIKLPQSVSLSNGALLIRYRAAAPVKNAVLTLKGAPIAFENGIYARFDPDGSEKGIRIPMPATPGLEGVREIVLTFGDGTAAPVDLTISGFEFVPAR
ncbi:MAG TPA: hypothetical protein PLD51_03900 [Pontiellaceae bacterium]|nr:hypothetical protein [Pontiellaceae bacterium]HPR82981.1 hypothetical protein [Pontiellaceae bacterium]